MAPRRLEMAALLLLAAWFVNCGGRGPVGPPGNLQGLTDPSIQPRVLSTYPSDGSTGPFNLFVPGAYETPHFVVELNKVIDRRAFRSSWFRIDGFGSPVNFQLARSIVQNLGSSDLLTRVLPVQVWKGLPYEVGRTYTVVVDTTLADLTGRHLQQPYRFSFTPEPWFRLLSSSPSAGAESVDPRTEITLQFNSAIDSTILASVQLLPSTPGSWHFRDPYSVTFRHLQELAYGTRYTTRIPANTTDVRGNLLHGAPFDMQFRVVPFRIEGSYPRDSQTRISASAEISVYASGPLDTSSVRAAFHIQPLVAGRLIARDREFDLFGGEFDLETRYTVTISTALHASDGTPLAAPYVFSFTTDRFRVNYNYPRDGESFLPRAGGVYISFNARIDSTSVQLAFSISPAVAGTFRMSDRDFSWKPNAQLAPLTIYTVTLSTSLRSLSGSVLAAPYTFAFRTMSR